MIMNFFFLLISILALLILSTAIVGDPLGEGMFFVEKIGREVHDSTESKVIESQMYPAPLRSVESGMTRSLRSVDGQSTFHPELHLQLAHWILDIIGWGTLLPIGALIARYYRRFPLKCDEWYSLHVLCQSSGYVMGTVSWAIGIWLGKSSKEFTLRTHPVLGIFIFSLSSMQMLAGFVQPKLEDEFCKCWKICHHVLGYIVIALIVANIFQGISMQSQADILKWFYVGILVILASIAATLEVYRWIKSNSTADAPR